MMYTIETARLGLRNWIDSDSPAFAAICGDKKVMEFFPSTLNNDQTAAMIGRLKTFLQNHPFGLWALEIKQTKTFIGFTGFSIPVFESHFTPCVEIGWRLAREHWGHGYATEAAMACLDYGFQELKLAEIVSFTAAINTRSIRVMQRIGMHPAGKFDHPGIEIGSPLRPHVLYKKQQSDSHLP